MTKNEAVQVNQIYSIFKRPLFSGHLCYSPFLLHVVRICNKHVVNFVF